MRRIKIDAKLSKKVNDFCDNLFLDRKFKKPIESLKELKNDLPRFGFCKEKRYIQHIIVHYLEILKATPSEILKFITVFDNIISANKIGNSFSEKIIAALRYEDLREKEFLQILKKTSINSCVYCNSQLAVVIDVEEYKSSKRKGQVKKRKGLLELDHFYPKMKYPFLCTSFFNLQPSCSSCNKAKSDDPALFNLYIETDELDVFKFSLEKDTVLHYWKKISQDEIKFAFVATDDKYKALLNNHEEIFRIQEIYNTQKDIVEELIHKSKAYTEAYKKNLVNNFTSLFPDKSIINRLLIGNYDKPEDIHKRPMSKFTQDIAKQLGLIK